MKVLVLGGAGYIGSVLVPYLKEKGDEVIVYDSYLYDNLKPGPDIRDIDKLAPAVAEADAIVNLAAISNDPASDLQPHLTWETNYQANDMLTDLCVATNKRIIFASSCSMYGMTEKRMTEEDDINPLTLYARTKMLAERFYLEKDINSVILRFATVYGHSPKPRFDLVVNKMIGDAYFKHQVTVNGGNQYRPVVHVMDVADAIYLALHTVSNRYKVYNVGSNGQNYTIKELGERVAFIFESKLILNKSDLDFRSYNVEFSRIEEDLGFVATRFISDAAMELLDAFNKGLDMEDDACYRVKYLRRHNGF